ncbi:MAG: TrkH family potassium uptake protein [Cellulosilyticaceae bacterium]
MDNMKDDIKIVSYYIGKIVIGIGLLLIAPIIVAIVSGEIEPLIDFIISISIFMIVGCGLELLGNNFKKRFKWVHGLIIAALTWIVLMMLAAIPYYLSGHFNSYLDAMFDVMSGFTTTGVILIQDVDHASNALNMWRHLLTFVGGQGMVVLALSFLITKGTGIFCMYVGEAKDEKLLPNVSDTAKAIWTISLLYLAVGTLFQTIAGLAIGMNLQRSFLHGMWVFMGAWSTGGFTPQSQNILYYHSNLYEMVTIVFFIIGSFNFALHHAIWKGNHKEIYRNIEIVSFLTTLTLTTGLATMWLTKEGIYTNTISMFRKVVYQMLSAHTTTGFMTVYGKEFLYDWGSTGIFLISIAMVIGGSASSTAGGIKGIRMGICFKALKQNMKKFMSSENRVHVEKYHFIRKNVLEDDAIKSALLITLLYLITFGIGMFATVFAGYSLQEAMFESASVTGNVGLTIGVTSPSMPNALKITYILIMWLARLEFISAFAFIGTIVGGGKKLCKKSSKKLALS